MKKVLFAVVATIGLVMVGIVFEFRHQVSQATQEPGYNTAVFLGINGTRAALGLPTNPPLSQAELRQNAIDTAMAPTRTPTSTHTPVPTRTSMPTMTPQPSRTSVPNIATRVQVEVNQALLAAGQVTLTPGPGEATQVYQRVNATLQHLGVATLTPSRRD